MIHEWYHESWQDIMTGYQGPHNSSLLINGHGRFDCQTSNCSEKRKRNECNETLQCFPLRDSYFGPCNSHAHPQDEFLCHNGRSARLRVINAASSAPVEIRDRSTFAGHRSLHLPPRHDDSITAVDTVVQLHRRCSTRIRTHETSIERHSDEEFARGQTTSIRFLRDLEANQRRCLGRMADQQQNLRWSDQSTSSPNALLRRRPLSRPSHTKDRSSGQFLRDPHGEQRYSATSLPPARSHSGIHLCWNTGELD